MGCHEALKIALVKLGTVSFRMPLLFPVQTAIALISCTSPDFKISSNGLPWRTSVSIVVPPIGTRVEKWQLFVLGWV